MKLVKLNREGFSKPWHINPEYIISAWITDNGFAGLRVDGILDDIVIKQPFNEVMALLGDKPDAKIGETK